MSIANTTGVKNINDSLNGVYTLYLSQDINTNTNCYLSFCRSNWIPSTGLCINGLSEVTYSDSNSCSIVYDEPATYIVACTVSASDFKVYFLVIVLGLILLIVGLVFINAIFRLLGGL